MPSFTLRTADRALVFTCRSGEAPPETPAGGPVIDRVNRPEKKEITEYRAHAAEQMVVSFKFDNWDEQDGASVEKALETLDALQGKTKFGAETTEPPKVIVESDPPGFLPYDLSRRPEVRWWVESVAEDAGSTKRDDKGRRMVISGTITLTEYVRDQTLLMLKKQEKQKKQKTHKVVKGETLSGIAKKYKVKGGWKALAKLNKIRDPRKLKTGQKIKLPA